MTFAFAVSLPLIVVLTVIMEKIVAINYMFPMALQQPMLTHFRFHSLAVGGPTTLNATYFEADHEAP